MDNDSMEQFVASAEAAKRAEEKAAGPVSFGDVINALGETSPSETNAAKIRTILGRGSNATIQKHLETIRERRIIAASKSDDGVSQTPIAPRDCIDALWSLAWHSASSKSLARLDAVTQERDGLKDRTQSQSADLLDLAVQLDDAEAKLAEQSVVIDGHAKVIAEVQSAAKSEIDAATQSAQAQALVLAEARAETASLKIASENASQVAARDIQILRLEHQGIVDRLTDQIGELKALRISQTTQN